MSKIHFIWKQEEWKGTRNFTIKRGRLVKSRLTVSLMRSIRLHLRPSGMGSENLAEVSSITVVTGCLGHLQEQPSVVEMSGMPFISFTGICPAFC